MQTSLDVYTIFFDIGLAMPAAFYIRVSSTLLLYDGSRSQWQEINTYVSPYVGVLERETQKLIIWRGNSRYRRR